jgi:ElaB/YqjD/DUF883 family membrane-anchored ribosome-binding protein
MKKLICMILAVLMAAAGAGCFAEGTEDSVTFLRIRENTTASVYATPGDPEVADALEGGSLCILVTETEAAGAAWYCVFYLNSRKEGATGYIKAEDAEKLSRDQLSELMNDLDQINKLLDLVDALNDYAGAGQEDVAQDETGNQGGKGSSKSGLEDLYNKAMDELAKLFSMDVASELEKISEVTEAAAEFAQDVGNQLLDAVAEGTADLLEKAGEELEDKLPEAEKALDALKDGISDALDYVQGGTMEEDLDKLLDEVSDSLDSLQKDAEEKYAEIEKDVQEKLDTLDKNFGKDTGDALDKINELVGKAQELLDKGIVQGGLSAIGEKFREDGFTEGVNSVSALLQLLGDMD